MVAERLDFRHPRDQIRAAINGSMMTAQINIIRDLAQSEESAIIATGAEIGLMPACVPILQQMGTIIHIRRKPETVLDCMKNDGKNHLVLCDHTTGEEVVMREEAVRLYAKELLQYKAIADLTIENEGSEEDALDLLVSVLKPLIIANSETANSET